MARSSEDKLDLILEKLSKIPEDLKSYGIEELYQRILLAKNDEERMKIHRDFCPVDESKDEFPICICYSDLNNQRYLNRYLVCVNSCLEDKGLYICSFHCAEIRMKHIFNKYFPGLSHIVFFFDFLWHRACPKLPLLKKFYYFINNKIKRVYPLVEVMGRLSYCGFDIRNIRVLNDVVYLVVQKRCLFVKKERPSYGLFISMPRVGKHKQIIHVHKVRTMYAYSEYLQGFTYEMNSLSDGGKFADDFRVSGWGRILRKMFLDEVPMFINVFKGDMKLVGVRPLTEQYFQLYTPEMQELRTRHKPGMFPPYYIETPHTLEDIQANERRYIEAYEAHRWRTQWTYFWKILFNVLIKQKHSS